MCDIRFVTCLEIVETDDLMACEHQAIDEMTSDESTSSRYENPLLFGDRQIPDVKTDCTGTYRTDVYVRCSRYVISRKSPEYCLSRLVFGRYSSRSREKGIPSSSCSFGRDITKAIRKSRAIREHYCSKRLFQKYAWLLLGKAVPKSRH